MNISKMRFILAIIIVSVFCVGISILFIIPFILGNVYDSNIAKDYAGVFSGTLSIITTYYFFVKKT